MIRRTRRIRHKQSARCYNLRFKPTCAITQTTPTEVRFWGVFCQEFNLAFRW
ncbi:hypothetical protein HMPREF9345_00192 [Escherichia coli MS 107-1]|nr:hypothetical protein HMPREF9345_00192 [Escherichia coli MS 107-1]